MQIGQLHALARCLSSTDALRGGQTPDDDALSRLVALRMRWYAVKREHPRLPADAEWVRELVQGAVGRVLLSDASAGAKAVASRAVAAWVVEDGEGTAMPSTAPPAAPSAAPSSASSTASSTASSAASSAASPAASPDDASAAPSAPEAKRFKVSGDGPGVQVEWTDADDELF
jgi:cell division septation protein DedD